MKVKKSPKKFGPPPGDLAALIKIIVDAPDNELAGVLNNFHDWKYARGDLHVWIPVLDRFDAILEDVIKSYNLDKLQINNFTPKTKELLLHILRVEKLLLESCTNRKLFNSYDRLSDLLLTNDLDVLQATIFTLLRPSQQYAVSIPLEPSQRHAILHRLAVLSRGWETLVQSGWDLATLATTDNVVLPDSMREVQINFYPTFPLPDSPERPATASVSAAAIETPTRTRPTLQSQNSSATPATAKGKAAQSAQAGPMVISLGDVTLAPLATSIDRLSTLADENHIPIEDQFVALNKLRLVIYTRTKESRRQMLAIRLLALATYVYISSEETAQSTLFLYEPELVPQLAEILHVADDVGEHVATGALLSLSACAHHRAKMGEVLTTVSANVNHGIIITFFRKMVKQLVQDVPLNSDLVDSTLAFVAFVATSPSHSSMLMGAGILRLLLDMLGTVGERREAYIPRATGLIDSILFSNPQALSNFSTIDGVNVLVQQIKTEIDLRLKASTRQATETMSEETIIASMNNPLKHMIRSIQRLMQASGGTEGLRNLVDSELPKSLKVIFASHSVFGPRVYALAINTMATFVHNEPTSLTILQELQLPQTLYGELEKGIPASNEVVVNVSNAIGAICLNQAGLDFTIAHPRVLTNLVKTVITAPPQQTPGERDHARHLGASLDELSRHHPALRPAIVATVIDLLKEASSSGADFDPSPEEKNNYRVWDWATSGQVLPEGGKPSTLLSNQGTSTFAVIFKVLSGLLRNSSISKEFIDAGGLSSVLTAARSPWWPVRWAAADSAGPLGHLLRQLAEHCHPEILSAVLTPLQEHMRASADLWKGPDVDKHWSELHAGTATGAMEIQWTAFNDLSVYLAMLNECIGGLANSYARVGTSVIRAVLGPDGSSFVSDLGKIHYVCFQIHVKFKSTKPAPAAAAPDAPLAMAEPDASAASDSIVSEVAATSSTSFNNTGDTAAKYLSTSNHATLMKLFKSFTKLIFIKRNKDPLHQKEAARLADNVAQVILSHLDRSSILVPKPEVEWFSLGVATILLFDGPQAEGVMNVTLFMHFEKKGGVEALLSMAQHIISQADSQDRSEKGFKADPDAAGGVKMVLHVLSALTSARSLVDSHETQVIEQSQNTDIGTHFNGTSLLLALRLAVFPLSYHVWNAPWLTKCPMSTIKGAIHCFTTLMEGKQEDDAANPIPASQGLHPGGQPARPPPVTPDTGLADQLVDMGFSRAAALAALRRARNNIAVATEIILSMPYVPEDDNAVNAGAAVQGK